MERNSAMEPPPTEAWGWQQRDQGSGSQWKSRFSRLDWTLGERWFCGCLMFFLVLILAAVITFNTLELIELNDINGEVYPVRCDDGDPCTRDFYRFEACHSLPEKNGFDCNDSCVVGGAGTCFAGECTGGCPGSCTVPADCPDILRFDSSVLDKICLTGGCVYRNFDPPPPFLLSAGSSGQLGEKLCDACLHPNEPLRGCLEILPFYPVVNPDNNLDSILCLFAFRCASYQRA